MSNSMQEVIVERIKGLEALINEKFDAVDLKFITNSEDHKEIKGKQDYTNGDVKKLKLWRAYLIGAWSVLSVILIAIVIPLMNVYLQEKVNVASQVDAVMQQYIEKVK